MYRMYFLLEKNHYHKGISSEEELMTTWDATWKKKLNIISFVILI